MNKTLFALTIVLAVGYAGSALADEVNCASNDGKYRECPLSGGGDIVMKKQLSKTACVKNKTWGETADGVYVKSGCRAIFESMDTNDSATNGDDSGYEDLIGSKAAGGEMDLQSRGYKFVRTTTLTSSKLGFWWKPNRSGCIQVTTSDGRYAAIKDVSSSQCGQGAGAASGGNSGGSFGAGQIVEVSGASSDALDAVALTDGPGRGGVVGRVGNGRLMTVDNCEGSYCHVRTTTGASTAGWISKRNLRAR